VILPLIPTYYI